MMPAKITVALISAAVMLLCCGSVSAAGIPGRDGVIHACVVSKGKTRGAVRLVRSARQCKRRRGERPVSWGTQMMPAAGTQGQPGAAGGQGPQGDRGLQGLQGLTGPAGQVEQALLDTIKDQQDQIDALSSQVSTLGQEVVNLQNTVGVLEGGLGGLETSVGGLQTTVGGLQTTVDSACTQLSDVTDQVDDVSAVVGGLGLNNALILLKGALVIPELPTPLGTFSCE